jgi:hypothetical protein
MSFLFFSSLFVSLEAVVMSVLEILSIRRKIATFLLASDTARLQMTCKTFLKWRAPYVLEDIYSNEGLLYLASRMDSLTIEYMVISSSDSTMATMVILATQIPLQISVVAIDGVRASSFKSPFVFKQFMTTCVSETTTFCAQGIHCGHYEKMLPEYLAFSHLKQIVIEHNYFFADDDRRTIINENADSRLRVGYVVINCFSTHDPVAAIATHLDFFLSRLSYVNNNPPVVMFQCRHREASATSKEIVDFCELIVSKCAGKRHFVSIHITLVLSDIANEDAVAVALENMMKSDIKWADDDPSFVVY